MRLRSLGRAAVAAMMAVGLLAPQGAWAGGASSVGSPTFSSTSPTDYTVGFTTSASGQLSGPAGFISLTFSGLTVTAATYSVTANGAPVSVSGSLVSTSTLQLTLGPGATIGDGTSVSISLQNLTNAVSPTVSIMTSGDAQAVTVMLGGGGGGGGSTPPSGGGASGPTSVQGVSVTPTPDTAGASATYTVAFAVYSGLAAGSGTITLAAPGTTFPSSASAYVITDSTHAAASGTVASPPTVGNGTVTFTVPNSIAAGDQLSIAVAGVTNPQGASASAQLLVSTSADVSPAAGLYAITAGAPAQLAFSQQPGGGSAGAAWGTQPSVAVEDPYGNLVTASTATVALSVYTNPGNGTLSCTGGDSLDASSGVADFSGCAIDQAGSGYRLLAQSGSLASAVSSTFNVAAGALPELRIASASGPASATAGQSISVTWSVYNSGAAAASGSWSDAVYLSPTSALGGSATQLATVSESVYAPLAVGASYTDSQTVTLPALAGGPEYLIFQTNATGSLTVSSSTYATFAVPVTLAAPQLAFTTQPGGGVPGQAWGAQPAVTAEDGSGAVLASFSGDVTLALAPNPESASLTCTGGTVVAAVYGVAAFSGCSVDKAGSGYTLTAAAAGATPATSAQFTIAAPAASGAILAVGGTAGGTVTGAMSQFLVGDNCWSSECQYGFAIVPPAPIARTGLASVFSTADHRLYAVGGADASGNALSTLEAYDPLINCWTDQCSGGILGLPAMPTARYDLAAALDPGSGVIYAIGGAATGGSPLATVEGYHLQSNAWQSAGAMPTARYGLAVVQDPSTGLIYAIGGTGLGGNLLATLEAFNPQTNAWQTLASMPTPRTGLAAALGTDGRIYAIGGTGANGVVATVEAYDPALNSWTAVASMPTARTGLAAVAGGDGRIYAIGGRDGSGNPLATVEAYTPGTNSWAEVAVLPVATYGLAAAAVSGVSGVSASPSVATAGASATYTVTFSATSGLSAGESVLLVAPSGTAFPSGNPGAYTVDGIAAGSVSASGNDASITVPSGVRVDAGGSVTVTVAGVTNPASVAANDVMQASTSADPAPEASNYYAISAGLPAKLAFTQQPGDAVAGQPLSPQPRVAVEDAAGNVVSSSAPVTLALANPNGATLTCAANPVNAVHGVASFGGCAVDRAASGYLLTASSSGLSSATSAGFNVTGSSAASLAVSAPASASAGQPFTITVTAKDANGNTVTGYTGTVHFTTSDGNAPNGSSPVLPADYTFTGTDAGQRTFSGITLYNAGNATMTVTDASTPSITGTSGAITVAPGTAAQLAFTTQPGGGAAGAAWSQQPVVTEQDAGGNTVTSSTAPVTLAIGTNTGSGTLACAANPVTAASGVASFSGCSIDNAGNGYTLTASASGITGATSGAFDVTAAGPLTITTVPSSLPAAVVGQPYSQQLKATGGTGTYTWRITGGALPTGLFLISSGTLSGTAPRADCCGEVGSVIQVQDQSTPPQTAKIDVLMSVVGTRVTAVTAAASPPTAGAPASTYTVGFTTSAGGALAAGDEISLTAPGGTAFSNQASDYQVEAGGSPVPVSQVNAYGTSAYITLGGSIAASTPVTVTAQNTASPPVPGSAYTLQVSTSGDAQAVTSPTYTLTAPILPGALAGSSLTVTPSPLIFSATSAPATLTVAVAVYLRDGSGNAVPNKTVALRVQGSSTGGLTWYVNGGDSATTDGGGAATFQVACSPAFYCIPGPLYLAATDTTDAVVVGGAAVPIYAYNVTFTGPQYSGSTADLGVSGLPPGQAVTATFNGSPLSLSGACATDGNGTLGSTGTCSFTVPAGTPNTDYPVVLTADGIQFQASFTLAPNPAGTPSTIAASAGTPQTATVGTAFATDLQAAVTDANGNGVSGVNVTFTVHASSSGAGATFAGGGTTATAPTDGSGVATAPALTANTKAGTFTVTASATGTGSAAFSLTATAGAPAAIQVAGGNPQATVVGTSFAAPLQVEVQDQYGNPVANASVAFAPPASGAGTAQGAVTASTTAAGLAQADFTANSTIGQFQVDATTAGAGTPAVFRLTNASAVLSSCDPATLASAISGQAPVWLLFPPNCTLTLPQTIVITSGQNVTLDGTGSAVNLSSGGGRAFDVEGGDLTLVDLTVGPSTLSGQNGQNGSKGSPGTDAGFVPTMSGGTGGAGGQGNPGGDAQGGAMYIAAAGTVNLIDATFSGNRAQGGSGGSGGDGGKGGQGGGGGQGSSTNTVTAAGDGGDGGSGGAGAPGGNARGGAIYNAGTLHVTGGAFIGDAAVGGSGGRGGNGGGGGNGGQGTTGPKGTHGADETCQPGLGGGIGETGGPGGNAGNAGASGPAASGGNGQGGAIYNVGTLTIAGTSFSDDVAQGATGGGGDQSPGAGGIGGVAGYGGNGGQGGAFVVPSTGCKNAIKQGGNGGNGGNGGVSGISGDGRPASDGGPGGAAQGGAIYNAGSMTIDGATFGVPGTGGNQALGGEGGAGGVGGDAPQGPEAGGGAGGSGGCVKYTSPAHPNGLIYPPCGLPGKSGKPGYGKQYGLGGAGGGGGSGGVAEGGAVFEAAGSTDNVGNLTFGADNGTSLAANLVTGGLGGPGGAGGYSKCALLASGGFGCYVTYGAGPILTGKQEPGGGPGAGGAGAGPDVFAAGSAPSQLTIVTDSLPGGSVGGGYWGFLQATGGVTPYAWTVVQGSLPPGLTLDPNGGDFTGTFQQAGTYLFTVQVQDSSTPALTAAEPLSITVPAQAVYQNGSTVAGSSNAASTTAGGSATAGGAGTPTSDVTANAQNGTGEVAVTDYNGDPGGGVSFQSTGQYFDVAVSQGSTFQSVTIQKCGLSAGDKVYWSPDGTTWQLVDPQTVVDASGCITLGPLTNSTSPTLAQLNGTPFAVAATPSPLAAGDTLTFLPVPLASDGSLAPGDTVSGAVYARTAAGSPVANATVYLALASGSAGTATADGTPLTSTPAPFTTDASGQVAVTYTAGLADTRTDTIEAASDASATPAVSATDTYTYATPVNPPASVSLQVSPAAAAPGDTVTLSGFVLDSGGNPVPNATVDLTASAGVLAALSVPTASDGSYSATLTMPDAGGATVGASVAGASPPVTAVAIAAPTGVSITGSASGSSQAGGSGATADTTAQASGGSGTVTVSEYSGNPGGPTTFSAAGTYFDVDLSPGSTFTAVSIRQCGLTAGDEVYWWSGTAWSAASEQSLAGGCATVTVDAATSPDLAELTGTPFAVAAAGAAAPSVTTTVTTSSTVGTSGGALTTPDGAFTLVLPAGAIAGGQSMAVSDATTSPAGAPALPSGMVAAGPFVTVVGPELAKALPATFKYTPATPSPDRLSVYTLSGEGWSFVATAVDTTSGTVSANIAGAGTYVVLAATAALSDVPAGFWAASAIDRTLAAGIVAGFPDGTFQPEAPVTRAQLTKMLVVALGLPQRAGSAFADVAASAWYAPFVGAASQAGIVLGVTPTRFDPGAPVTREQMAVMIARALKLSGTAATSFTDSAAIDGWAAVGVRAAVAAGYMAGFPDGSFQPLATATRAQAADVLAGLIASMAP